MRIRRLNQRVSKYIVLPLLILAGLGTECLSRRYSVLPVAFAQSDVTNGLYFGEPLPALTAQEEYDYVAGFKLFVKVWNPDEGLGARFNAKSCVTCHRIPLPGGSGTTPDTFVLHIVGMKDKAGGSVFQRFELDANNSQRDRTIPTGAKVRKTQPMFGLGLLESVPVTELIKRADPTDKDHDGVKGHLATIGDQYGRFGWKGDVATIEQFVRNALEVEMGFDRRLLVPSHHQPLPPSIPQANGFDPKLVDQLASFIRFLAAPPTAQLDQYALQGRQLFERIGCAICHVPTLVTGSVKSEALSRKVIHPYSDLLLHDMGPALDEGIPQGNVSSREFRTAPLWGLNFTGPPYLHDGRALTLGEAIEAHDGEAKSSADHFRLLTLTERQNLLHFLRSL
jgi:CxxC motif-containing protein (DUF1111 family)